MRADIKFAASIVITSLLASWAQAQGSVAPTFYLSPGEDPGGDLAWQSAVGGSFSECDFEAFFDGDILDTLTIGGLVADVELDGIGGVASTAEIFASSFFVFPGVVMGNALLNRDASDQVHSQIVLEFPQPVEGAGAWVYDDGGSVLNSSWVIATDGNGDVWVSPILESGNGFTHAVEGFIGVTSPVGVRSIAFENLDATLQPVDLSFMIDHVQVGDAMGLAAPYGCGVNPPGSLVQLGGAPTIGTTWTLGVDNPLGTQPAGSSAFLAISNAPDAAFPCGTLLPGWGMSGPGSDGELLISLAGANPLATFGPVPWAGAGNPAAFALSVPGLPALVGKPFYMQGMIMDGSGTSGIDRGLTEALEVRLGL